MWLSAYGLICRYNRSTTRCRPHHSIYGTGNLFVFTVLQVLHPLDLIVCTAPDAKAQESASMREHAHESAGSTVMTRLSGLYYSIELLRAAHV